MASSTPIVRAVDIQTRLVEMKTLPQQPGVKVILQTRPMAYKDYPAKAASTHIDAEDLYTFSAWMVEPLRDATVVLGLFHTSTAPDGSTSEHETWAGAMVHRGRKKKHLFLYDCNVGQSSGLPNFLVQSATKGQSELGAYLCGKFNLNTIWVGGEALGNGDTPFELTMQWLEAIWTFGETSSGWDSFKCVWKA
ncbi:hypothetical protein MMC34_001388 [Xylographa carneopallida]|nr:hypothetical protein [Xylographa carneopallida]